MTAAELSAPELIIINKLLQTLFTAAACGCFLLQPKISTQDLQLHKMSDNLKNAGPSSQLRARGRNKKVTTLKERRRRGKRGPYRAASITGEAPKHKAGCQATEHDGGKIIIIIIQEPVPRVWARPTWWYTLAHTNTEPITKVNQIVAIRSGNLTYCTEAVRKQVLINLMEFREEGAGSGEQKQHRTLWYQSIQTLGPNHS